MPCRGMINGMETRICTRCNAPKPIDEYPHVRGRINSTRCNACLAELRRLERETKRANRPPKVQPLRDRDRTMKVCNRCGIEKPVSEFYWNQRRWDHRCRTCRSEVDKERRIAANRLKPPKPRVQQPLKLKPTAAERFWLKVDKREPNDCWPWLGHLLRTGYGVAYLDGQHTTAHRVAYILFHGSIPEGMTIDHLCHTKACKLGDDCPHRRCCNPRHLELVTPKENSRRGNGGLRGVPKPSLLKTACPHGHPYDEQNTAYTKKGHRICKECRRLRAQQFRDRQRLRS